MDHQPASHTHPTLLPDTGWQAIRTADLLETVLSEIKAVVSGADDAASRRLVQAIFAADRILVYGAGRMGIMSAAFAMRLAQLGFRCHLLGEPTTPGVGSEDLLILSSASGETQTVHQIAALAKARRVRIALVTAQPESSTGRLADLVVRLPMPNKRSLADSPASIQPMTSLSEQSVLLYFDLLVLWIMQASGQSSDDLWKRHFNLE
jgi:6-phospho-3-hexuloisomerase